MTGYPRTGFQKAQDRERSKAVEATVQSWLPDHTHSRVDSTTELDFWVPGAIVEVKGKYQPLGVRWIVPGWSEEDSFIIDELSVRKLLGHYPGAYVVFFDGPMDRWFLASAAELACCGRVRLNRTGPTGVKKGKWVIRLTEFTELKDPQNDLMPAIFADQLAMNWKNSACLSALDVREA